MTPRLRQLPNLITAVRIVLIAPITAALWRHDWPAAIGLFGAAAASDAADGFLARRYGWQTRLGAWLDPAADKLLLAAIFVTLAIQRSVPVWLAAAVVGRDLVIVGGALAYRARVGRLQIRPTALSKINTLLQLLFALSTVARLAGGWPPAWFVTQLGALMFVVVAVSGLDYVLTYAGRAARQPRRDGGVS
ncbi:MAG: CDP-alcohol phosphatidyltransferase family protein [Gammaproteobacteria bacterium]|nr:CDP-alcohol phosphatidyltransferase family protein [Gammaproteobacteria bacterium]